MKEIKTIFSDKIKAVDTKWKIKTFKQEKKNIVDFIIKFEALAIKTNTNELYAIFLLKKNTWHNIIKTILGYPSIAIPKTLKEWKVVVILVEQEYKSTKKQHNYRTSTGITYGKWEQLMNIKKSNNNFKNRKPKYFNYNKYGYIAKECWLEKKEQEIQMCFKYNKKRYITKDYKRKQTMKKWKVQKEIGFW